MVWQNEILRLETDRLIQRELSLFHLMQDRQSKRQFEHGLHWRVGFGIDVAVHRRTGQRAGYGYPCVRVCCNITNLLLERRLSDGEADKERKDQAKTHVPNLGI